MSFKLDPRIWKIWGVVLAMKLFIAAVLPLQADEAYYWVWSHHLQLSYYDHPAMVAWLMSLGHFLEGVGQAIRWPGVILGSLTILIGLFYLRDFTGEEEAVDLNFEGTQKKVFHGQIAFLILTTLSPMLGFGSLIQTPDVPVVFFWTLSMYLTRKSLQTGSWKFYSALGISLGLGFCSKYHIVLFVPCLLLYLFGGNELKKIQWKWIPLVLLLGLAACVPVLLFNYQDDWRPFKFQLEHGLSGESFSWKWPANYLVAQFFLIHPVVVLAILKASVPKFRKHFFDLVFGLGPFVFFFYASFKASGEANWPIIGLPGIYLLASQSEFFTRKFERVYVGSLMFLYFLVAVIFISPALRMKVPKAQEFFSTREIALETKAYRPIYAQNFQLASLMSYHLKENILKLRGIDRFDFFDTLAESAPSADGLFYLVRRPNNKLPAAYEKSKVTVLKALNPEFELVKVEP